MATLVVGDIDVDVDIDDYGSFHDEELVVPLPLMDHNRTNSKHPSSSTPSWKTKKLMCAGIIGMTAAVASSALLLFSIIKKLSGTAPTEELFLLHASVGADDDKCVAATGPWPTGSKSYMQDDDDDTSLQPHSGPYVSCFVSTTGGYCWSHSYYGDGDWKPCTPNGYGVEWSIDSASYDDYQATISSIQHPVETCGTGCTEFSNIS